MKLREGTAGSGKRWGGKKISSRYGAASALHLEVLRRRLIGESDSHFGQPGFGKFASALIDSQEKPDYVHEDAWTLIKIALRNSLNGINGLASQHRNGTVKPKNRKPGGKVKRGKSRSQRVAEYKAYLQSAHWKATRVRILAQRGALCQRCGSAKRIEVHHVSYARRGAELDADLLVLCGKCHGKEHGK